MGLCTCAKAGETGGSGAGVCLSSLSAIGICTCDMLGGGRGMRLNKGAFASAAPLKATSGRTQIVGGIHCTSPSFHPPAVTLPCCAWVA